MIRLVNSDNDLLQIAHIHTDNRRREYKNILPDWYLDKIDYDYSFSKWKSYSKYEDEKIIVYEEENVICGFAAVRLFYDKVDCGLLSNLHIKSNMQSKGIGKKLIQASGKLLNDVGIHSMEIFVVDGNQRAADIYSHLGAEFVTDFVDKFENIDVKSKKFVFRDLTKWNIDEFQLDVNYDYDIYHYMENNVFYLFADDKCCDVFFGQFEGRYKPLKILQLNSEKKFYKSIEISEPFETVNNIIIASRTYSECEKYLENIKCKNYFNFYPWHLY